MTPLPRSRTSPRPARATALLLALATLAIAAGATGCRPKQTEADRAIAEGILLLGNGSEPKDLDPHRVTGVTENKIISALLEGLVAYHPTDDNEAAPGMAERWESDAEARVWTFHLREAQWSNGDPVRASDFVYAHRRMLTPDLGAEYANLLYLIDGAEAYHRGETTDFSTVGVVALDERTVRYRLVGPTPYFPSVLQHYSWFPVHPPTIEAHGGIANRQTRWTRPESFVGNGPFVLARWEVSQVIEVRKNPRYWDAATVSLEGIRFFPIEDRNTEERAFRAGQLHYMQEVPSSLVPVYRERHAEELRIDPYLGTYFYRVNVTRPPFDDPRVRRALALAIDRRTIAERITQGDQVPAYGFTPPGMRGFPTPQRVGWDPDEARRLLAEAGYPGGAGFPADREILINTSENHRKIAEAVQEMWRRELGISIGLVNQEWKVYLDSQSNLEYDISRSGWIGDFMDPITFLEMWTTGNGNNDTGWTDPEFDRLIAEAFRDGDGPHRLGLLLSAEQRLLDALPVLPVYWYTRVYAIDPRVEGWAPKLLDNRPYKHIRLRAP